MIRILLVLAALAHPALAQSVKDQAKAHFKQARALQERGDYERAAHEYEAAYELDHRPEMLFNIAQAYRLAGDKRAALDHYQRYLAAQPAGAGAAEARQHVAELTRQLDAERPATPTPPPLPPPVTPPVTPPSTTPPIEVAPPSAPPRDEPAPRSSPGLRIAGLATAGLGAIAIGAGIKLGLDARAASDAISGHSGDWTDADRAQFADGERANRNMAIAFVAGGALVTTGTVLYLLGRRAHVAPIAGGGGVVGALAWGRF